MDSITRTTWDGIYSVPNRATILTLGYSTFSVPSDVVDVLVRSAAYGQIREVDKRYNSTSNEYEAIIKGPVTVTGECLKIVQDNSAEIKKLEDEIKRLKGEPNA